VSFLVAQLGPRMHYAVPRILYQAGLLDRLATDICAVKGWPRLLRVVPRRLRSAGLARLLARVPEGIPPARIAAFTAFGLEYARRRAAARTPEECTAVHLWAGREFCRAILRRGLGAAAGVYAFNSAALELLQHARQCGLTPVLEQIIAPIAVENDLLAAEHDRFPQWEPPLAHGPNRAAAAARERAEWDAAGIIVCGSDFVRDGIAACGGPAARCAVVPYGIDSSLPPVLRTAAGRPLRVLSVGAVGLRKGSPYVLAAARALQGDAEFRLVGHLTARPEALRALPDNVVLTGPVPRSHIGLHYAWADVFLLPSLCEGSAAVCYEALAAGLPVVTTPNAGSVVRDGVEGFLVPIRDADAIAARLETLRNRGGLLAEMSRNAALRAAEFTLARYADRLLPALTR
jgi:glycosyltransferase involved in cell wall biosynthesis